MHTGVGPFDGRKARKKRCEGCIKRKIKCHGGLPCENCIRMGRSCIGPAPAPDYKLVFVYQTTQPITPPWSLVGRSVSRPPDFERNLNYFVNSFLPLNMFSSELLLDKTALQDVLEMSPALRDAISAVSALHRSLISPEININSIVDKDSYAALRSYHQSVKYIQRLIAGKTFEGEPHALWSTFFLGLFEERKLMRDASGQNWLLHFLHGTCAILRLQRPSSLLLLDAGNIQRRRFFFATRIFEISRSLIYTEPTFLNEPHWVDALEFFWTSEGASLWHPKEALFDMLPKFSELSIRTLNFCYYQAADLSVEERNTCEKSLAAEGIWLQQSLEGWRHMAAQWAEPTSLVGDDHLMDLDMLIAQLYFHTTNIYLSGIFDYHVHWTKSGAPYAPILTRGQVEAHMEEIVQLSHELLVNGVSGIILFFPLRVAGARSSESRDRDKILNFLCRIRERGYTVANAFIDDLVDLWQ